MASRPRHEALRGLVTELLREGFGAAFSELEHERYLVDNSGRVDVAWGATVIELKTDLRREERDVVARMPDYLEDASRRSAPGRTTVGLATDGATLLAYKLDRGTLAPIGRYNVDVEHPERLLSWLESLLSPVPEVMPTPDAVALALGRYSLPFGNAHWELRRLWSEVGDRPEVRLKRDLWDGLLRQVYGDDVGSDALFLQHTYLTILVKAIAARVLDLAVDDPAELLSGQLLANEGIVGAVEADFFDWLLLAEGGDDLVRSLAGETARFRLRDVEVDVLKSLYESLIDPDERHDLGEYYTPDWLAARVVAAVIPRPLEQRVLDPSCGSGTFLFHALRRLIAAGREARLPPAEIVATCADRVFGIDVHPVAVALARVTWLLALGDLVQDRPPTLSVPVFMGDSMQWSLRPLGASAEVLVDVPPNDPPLRIPAGLASDLNLFERALDELNRGLDTLAEPEAIRDAIARAGATAEDATLLGRTFGQLKQLYLDGRNHIWTFVLRNLLRPVWLSHPDHRADVLIGNPPWIVYRHLSAEMKDRLREALQSYNLWIGGNLATQQDMFALFWARGAERYLRDGGTLALVLPYAALNAPVFAGMRNGRMERVRVAITGGWSGCGRSSGRNPAAARLAPACCSASATGRGDRRRRWNAGRACCLGAMQARARRQRCSHMRVPLGPDPERWFPHRPTASASVTVQASFQGGSFWSSMWQPDACKAAAMRHAYGVARAISTSARGRASSLPKARLNATSCAVSRWASPSRRIGFSTSRPGWFRWRMARSLRRPAPTRTDIVGSPLGCGTPRRSGTSTARRMSMATLACRLPSASMQWGCFELKLIERRYAFFTQPRERG
jgi:SAM-dependent methyltransferase